MAHISVQDLQNIAVSTTSDFYNHGVPLSVGLAKQASERGLNSDQIRRSIEATNTLAYLKSVDGSDRTGEFPLADYDEILKCASLPECLTETKTPVGAAQSPKVVKTEEEIKAQYQKSVEDQGFPEPLPELSKQASIKFLYREASINRRALEDAQARAFHFTFDLEKAASDLAKTPHAVEALSRLTNGIQFTKLARLTFGVEDTPAWIDWAEAVPEHNSWKPALEKAASLAKMLQEAQDTIEEINHRTGLQKQAGLLMDAAAGVGKAVRSVATAPFRYAGNKVANGASAMIDSAATKLQTGLAGTSVGKSMGVQPGALKPSTVATMASSKKMVGGATLAAGAGLDAVGFRPKNNPAKGQNGDAWDALNG